MSQVNLLPPEIRQRQVARRRTFLVAAAGVAALVLVALFYFAQFARLASANSDLAAQQQKNIGLQAKISQLGQFAKLQGELQSKQKLLNTVLANQISWSKVLLDVSRVIPEQATLSGLSGQINVATGTPTAGVAPTTTTQAAGLVGTITFQGTALGLRTVASWLDSLKQVPGWENPLASNIAQSSSPGLYQFSSTVDLSKQALVQGATP